MASPNFAGSPPLASWSGPQMSTSPKVSSSKTLPLVSGIAGLSLGPGKQELGRTLAVRHLPQTVTDANIASMFERYGAIENIDSRFRHTHGIVLVTFFDVRHADIACSRLNQRLLQRSKLDVSICSPSEAAVLSGRSTLLSTGCVRVFGLSPGTELSDIRRMFSRVGAIRSATVLEDEFAPAPQEGADGKAGGTAASWDAVVQYFDVRDAAAAQLRYDAASLGGSVIRVTLPEPTRVPGAAVPALTAPAPSGIGGTNPLAQVPAMSGLQPPFPGLATSAGSGLSGATNANGGSGGAGGLLMSLPTASSLMPLAASNSQQPGGWSFTGAAAATPGTLWSGPGSAALGSNSSLPHTPTGSASTLPQPPPGFLASSGSPGGGSNGSASPAAAAAGSASPSVTADVLALLQGGTLPSASASAATSPLLQAGALAPQPPLSTTAAPPLPPQPSSSSPGHSPRSSFESLPATAAATLSLSPNGRGFQPSPLSPSRAASAATSSASTTGAVGSAPMATLQTSLPTGFHTGAPGSNSNSGGGGSASGGGAATASQLLQAQVQLQEFQRQALLQQQLMQQTAFAGGAGGLSPTGSYTMLPSAGLAAVPAQHRSATSSASSLPPMPEGALSPGAAAPSSLLQQQQLLQLQQQQMMMRYPGALQYPMLLQPSLYGNGAAMGGAPMGGAYGINSQMGGMYPMHGVSGAPMYQQGSYMGAGSTSIDMRAAVQRAQAQAQAQRQNHSGGGGGGGNGGSGGGGKKAVDKKSFAQFAVNLSRVNSGEDARTTIMVRNIPNKYKQQQLLQEIAENHMGRFDFFYLPIDFRRDRNIGYAFVNFLTPQDIIPFFNEFNNRPWALDDTGEKICEVAYARIQGLDPLVAHFQSSTIMQARSDCRPLLFPMEGPNKGKAVPFPLPPGSQRNANKTSRIHSANF